MRFGHYESEGTNERRRGEDARLREAKLMAEAARAQHLIHKARLCKCFAQAVHRPY